MPLKRLTLGLLWLHCAYGVLRITNLKCDVSQELLDSGKAASLADLCNKDLTVSLSGWEVEEDTTNKEIVIFLSKKGIFVDKPDAFTDLVYAIPLEKLKTNATIIKIAQDNIKPEMDPLEAFIAYGRYFLVAAMRHNGVTRGPTRHVVIFPNKVYPGFDMTMTVGQGSGFPIFNSGGIDMKGVQVQLKVKAESQETLMFLPLESPDLTVQLVVPGDMYDLRNVTEGMSFQEISDYLLRMPSVRYPSRGTYLKASVNGVAVPDPYIELKPNNEQNIDLSQVSPQLPANDFFAGSIGVMLFEVDALQMIKIDANRTNNIVAVPIQIQFDPMTNEGDQNDCEVVAGLKSTYIIDKTSGSGVKYTKEGFSRVTDMELDRAKKIQLGLRTKTELTKDTTGLCSRPLADSKLLLDWPSTVITQVSEFEKELKKLTAVGEASTTMKGVLEEGLAIARMMADSLNSKSYQDRVVLLQVMKAFKKYMSTSIMHTLFKYISGPSMNLPRGEDPMAEVFDEFMRTGELPAELDSALGQIPASVKRMLELIASMTVDTMSLIEQYFERVRSEGRNLRVDSEEALNKFLDSLDINKEQFTVNFPDDVELSSSISYISSVIEVVKKKSSNVMEMIQMMTKLMKNRVETDILRGSPGAEFTDSELCRSAIHQWYNAIAENDQVESDNPIPDLLTSALGKPSSNAKSPKIFRKDNNAIYVGQQSKILDVAMWENIAVCSCSNGFDDDDFSDFDGYDDFDDTSHWSPTDDLGSSKNFDQPSSTGDRNELDLNTANDPSFSKGIQNIQQTILSFADKVFQQSPFNTRRLPSSNNRGSASRSSNSRTEGRASTDRSRGRNQSPNTNRDDLPIESSNSRQRGGNQNRSRRPSRKQLDIDDDPFELDEDREDSSFDIDDGSGEGYDDWVNDRDGNSNNDPNERSRNDAGREPSRNNQGNSRNSGGRNNRNSQDRQRPDSDDRTTRRATRNNNRNSQDRQRPDSGSRQRPGRGSSEDEQTTRGLDVTTEFDEEDFLDEDDTQQNSGRRQSGNRNRDRARNSNEQTGRQDSSDRQSSTGRSRSRGRDRSRSGSQGRNNDRSQSQNLRSRTRGDSSQRGISFGNRNSVSEESPDRNRQNGPPRRSRRPDRDDIDIDAFNSFDSRFDDNFVEDNFNSRDSVSGESPNRNRQNDPPRNSRRPDREEPAREIDEFDSFDSGFDNDFIEDNLNSSDTDRKSPDRSGSSSKNDREAKRNKSNREILFG